MAKVLEVKRVEPVPPPITSVVLELTEAEASWLKRYLGKLYPTVPNSFEEAIFKALAAAGL